MGRQTSRHRRSEGCTRQGARVRLRPAQALRQFLDDPQIALDNNNAERAQRVVAVGRKNGLFVGHFEGGQNLTVLQTICHTRQLHGVSPSEYLSDVLVRVRKHPASPPAELLPQNWVSPPA